MKSRLPFAFRLGLASAVLAGLGLSLAGQPATSPQPPGTNRAATTSAPSDEQVVGLLRLSDMGTNEVLDMLEQFTGKAILRQQNLPTVRINFTSQGPMTRGEAILALESLLALNGIAITEVGDRFLKAVPAAQAAQQVPDFIAGSTLNMPASQRIYSTFYFLDYLLPPEAAQIVQPLMSQGAPLAYQRARALLVTDSLTNLQRIERVLNEVDSPSSLNTAIMFIELEHTEAPEVARRLEGIAQGPLGGRLQGNTTIDADERTNQLLIFTHPSNEEMLREIVTQLDIDVAPLTTTEIYYIKHAEAPEVQSLIETIVTGQQNLREEAGGNPQGTGGPGQQPGGGQQAQAQQTGASADAAAKNLQFSDYLTLAADERANSIIASGTDSDHTYLKELIEKIDILLAQVRIEVVIAEVTLTEDEARGIDSFGTVNVTRGTNDDEVITVGGIGADGARENIISVPSGSGLGSSPFAISGVIGEGGNFDLDFVINTAKRKSNVRILQAPTIVTTHNREASISVGQARPVITSSTTDFSNVNNTRSTVQFRDIGIELTVLPLIGTNGTVQMEITQTVESVVDEITIDGNVQPIIGTREATSFLGVQDGQLIVLGGLQEYTDTEGKGSMFLFGDLPLFGPLFRSTTETDTRRELLFFIKPTVIQGVEEADADTRSLIERHSDQKALEDYLEDGQFSRQEDEPTGTKRVIRRGEWIEVPVYEGEEDSDE